MASFLNCIAGLSLGLAEAKGQVTPPGIQPQGNKKIPHVRPEME